jgi:hypothetical protein
VQDRVEVPEPPVIEVGLKLQVRPVVGDIVSVRLTVSVNPFRGATVMVDVSAIPVFPVTLVGLALIVKSVTVNVAVSE